MRKMLPAMGNDDVREAVRDLIRVHGEKEALRRLGMPKTTVARLAGDLAVREGTLLLARVRLGLSMPAPAPKSADR
jgi:hypothetical protein